MAQNDFNIGLSVTPEVNQTKIQSDIDKQTKNIKLKIDASVNDASISNLEKKYTKLSQPTEKLKSTLSQINVLNQELGKSSGEKMISNYKELNKLISSASSQMKILSNQEGINSSSFNLTASKSQLSNNISTFINSNSKLTSSLKADLIGLQNQVQSADKLKLDQLKQQFSNVKSEAESLGKVGSNVFSKLAQNAKQLLSFFASTTLVLGSFKAFQAMVEDVKELNKEMISLRKVTNETDYTYSKFLDNSAQKAKELGTSISDLVKQTAEWAKAGYGLKDSSSLAEVSTLFKNVSDVSVDQSVSDIVTPLKAFNLEAKDAIEVVNKLNEVDNNFSVSSADIGTGLANSASALALAGNDINESIALITGGSEITQDSSEMGNAVKVLSMRLRGMKGDLEDIGEEFENVDSVSKIQTQIYNLTQGSVNIMDDLDPTKFKSTYEIIQGISKVWSQISETDQASLLEIVAGKQRGNQVAALISSFESGQAQSALDTSINSKNSALNEQKKYMDGIEYSADRLNASLQELSSNTLSSDWVKLFYDISNGVVNATTDIGLFNVALIAGFATLSKFSNLGLTKTLLSWSGGISNATASLVSYATQGKINLLQKEADTVATGEQMTATQLSVVSTNAETLAENANTIAINANTTATQANVIAKGQSAESESVLASSKLAESASMGVSTAETMANSAAMGASTVATEGATAATTMLGTALKLVPLVAFVGLVYGAVKVLDYFITTQQEAIEATEKASSAYQEAVSEIESVNNELDTTKSRMDELEGKSALTFVEQSELDKLKYANQELKNQLILLQKQKDLKQGDLEQATKTEYDKSYGKESTGTKHWVAEAGTSWIDQGKFAGNVKDGKVDSSEEAYLEYSIKRVTELNSIKEKGVLLSKDESKEYEKLAKYLTTAGTDYSKFLTNYTTDDSFRKNIAEISDAIAKALDPNAYKNNKFSEIFDDESFSETKAELEELSKAGKLDESVITGNEKYKKLLSETGLTASEVVTEINALTSATSESGTVAEESATKFTSMSDAIDALSGLKDGMEALDSAYSKFVSNDEKIGFEDLENLKEKFGDLELPSFDNFLKTISNSASTADEVSQAFSTLTSEYIDQTKILDGLTFATAGVIAQGLQEMGVANAQEVVYSALGVTKEQYARITAYCTQNGLDLTNMTYQEIQALVNETGVTQQAAQQMYIFALKKALANENVLSTTSDIQNLIALVSALGGATSALDIYNAAKSGQVGMGGMRPEDMATLKQNALSEANSALTSALNSTTSLSNAAPNIDFSGGADSAKALADNAKDAADSAKDATDALKEAWDAFNKLMSHEEAMGMYENDPMKYVGRLGELASTYVYDLDTAREAEEKIYAAREKYLDEWINKAQDVYSGVIDMLDVYQNQLKTKMELGDFSKSTDDKYIKTFVDEAKKYAEKRNYLQSELKDYLKKGGKKGDDRWTELTNSIADANSKIDETKLALKEVVEEYTSDWVDAIESVYDAQISSAEKYQDRLSSLFSMTGDTKYQTEGLKNYLSTLSTYQQKYATQQKAIQDGLSKGTISTNSNDGYKYEEFLKLQGILDTTTDSINSLKENIKSFADEAVDTLVSGISNLGSGAIDLIDLFKSALESEISKIEANGGIVGEPIYEALIENSNKELKVLLTKKQVAEENLAKAVKEGTIIEGDDDWQDLVTTINEATEAINSSEEAIIDYNNAIMELDFSKFDDLLKKLNEISDEIGNVISTIDKANLDLVNDDASLSSDGLATLALQLQQREEGIATLQKIKSEIANLESSYASGISGMSETEYAERLATLKEQQYNWVEKIQGAEQSVLDIYNEQKEAQIKLIQDKIDALQEENDEYQRALDLQKAKYALEQAMNNRNKMVFNGKEFEYSVDMDAVNDARSNLSDLELQGKIADLEKQIKAIEAEVPNLNNIIKNSIDLVNANATEVYEALMEYSEKYGLSISDYILSAWNGVIDSETGATNALTQFGVTVTNTSSKSVSALTKVQSKVNDIYNTANYTAQSIVTMLTPSTQYIEEKLGLINSDINIINQSAVLARDAIYTWNQIDLSSFNQTTTVANNGVDKVRETADRANTALSNLNKINVYTDTGTTKQSIDALKKGIKDSKDEVDELKRAVDALDGMEVNANVKVSSSGLSDIEKRLKNLDGKTVTTKHVTVETTENHTAEHGIMNTSTGRPMLETSTKEEAQKAYNANKSGYDGEAGGANNIQIFKNGGRVSSNGNSPTLDQVAQSVGEHHLVGVRDDEVILTAKDGNTLEKLIDIMPTAFNILQPLTTLPDYSSMVSNKAMTQTYAPSFTIAPGAITLQGVNDVNGLSEEIVRNLGNKLTQEIYKR